MRRYEAALVSLVFFAHAQATSSQQAQQRVSLEGRVVDRTGQSLPGTSVTIRSDAGLVASMQADPTGAFRFFDLPEGSFTVDFDQPNFNLARCNRVQVSATGTARADATLQILSPVGFVLAQNDDERGVDPLLAFTAPTAGAYVVRTFAFPPTANSSINFAGGDAFVYRLTLTTEAFVDAALPMAVRANEDNRLALLG